MFKIYKTLIYFRVNDINGKSFGKHSNVNVSLYYNIFNLKNGATLKYCIL